MRRLEKADLNIILSDVSAGLSYSKIADWFNKKADCRNSVGKPLTATDISRFLIKHGHRKIKPYKKRKKMNSFTLPRNDAELQEYMEKARARTPEQSPIRRLERIVEKYRFVWHMEMLAKGFAVEKIKEMQKEIES